MKNKEAKELLDKYLAGACTPYEKRLVEEAYDQSIPQSGEELAEEKRAELKIEIWQQVNRNMLPSGKTGVLRRRLITLSAAAIALIAMITGLYFYFSSGAQKDGNHLLAAEQVIVPGGNKATLTFSDGRTIDLSSDKDGLVMGKNVLRYSDGSQVKGMEESPAERIPQAAYVTLSTPKGGQYQVRLPDGSKVWLNATSSIKYPSSFAGLKERRVELMGEAYFEVAKDKGRPFLVSTERQTVKVLGTHFNINSYADEPAVRTTLIEGAVRVLPLNEGIAKPLELRPGQQSILSEKGLQAVATDVEAAIGWKNGEFVFKNEGVESIMRRLARWYNVSVEYQDYQPNAEMYSGTLSRFDNISTVLHMMETTGDIRFKIEGRKILVFKSENVPRRD